MPSSPDNYMRYPQARHERWPRSASERGAIPKNGL
jgi:hypothetical protein